MNTETTRKLTFNVKGMRCGGCVRSVERILGNINGVKEFSVRVGSFEVVLDPEQVQGSDIVAALQQRGGLGVDFQEEAP